MKIQSEKGFINISNEIIAAISGYAATNCFGVKGMAHTNITNGIVHLLKKEYMTKGVKVESLEDGIKIHLNIIVEHGVNINTVCRSVMSEVAYVVEQNTGLNVLGVNISVDSVMQEGNV